MIDNKLVMRKLLLIAGVFATLSCSGVEKVEGVNDDKTDVTVTELALADGSATAETRAL